MRISSIVRMMTVHETRFNYTISYGTFRTSAGMLLYTIGGPQTGPESTAFSTGSIISISLLLLLLSYGTFEYCT